MTEETKAELMQLESELRRKAKLNKNTMDISLSLANIISDLLKGK